jgi:hypothetical protein
MTFLKAARGTVIGALVLLATACTTLNAQQSPSPSSLNNDNGANCGGTPGNQVSCVNNQNRMP